MAWKKVAVLGCLHFPIIEPTFEKWAVKKIKSYQPDYLVINGDALDAKCVSRFEHSNSPTLLDEYRAFDNFLESLSGVVKSRTKAKNIFLKGNHEFRIFQEHMKTLSDLLDPVKHIPNLKWFDTSRDYIYKPEHAFSLGQLTVAHSFGLSKSAIFQEAVSLGVPSGLYVHSHTHKGHAPEQIQHGIVKYPYWIANTGTAIWGSEPYFQQYRTHDWTRGMVFVDVETSKRHSNQKYWEATYLEHSRFWE